MDYDFDENGITVCPTCYGSGLDNGYVHETVLIYGFDKCMELYNDEDKVERYVNDNYDDLYLDALMFIKNATCQTCNGDGELDWIEVARGEK